MGSSAEVPVDGTSNILMTVNSPLDTVLGEHWDAEVMDIQEL